MSSIETEFGSLAINTANLLPVSRDGPCRIVDGDTIIIGGQSWRLDGFDAPAVRGLSRGQPHCDEENQLGLEAIAFLEEELKRGAALGALHIDIINKSEKHRRQLVRVYVAGQSLAEIMIEAGYGYAFDGKGAKLPWCQCEDRWNLYHAEALVAVNKEHDARVRRRETRAAKRIASSPEASNEQQIWESE